MAPVARELALNWSVLEPLQTAGSLEGQVEELKKVLKNWGHPPLTLIGHSWGAWLSFILAARHPECVRKLILVGSGPSPRNTLPPSKRPDSVA
jgi:pimeloyl-ACP methyl ester carboxylesterase